MLHKTAILLLVLVSLTSSYISIANPLLLSAELVENSWSSQLSMPTPRAYLGLATVNGKIYAIGGDAYGTNEMYDSVQNNWTTKTPMPTPRSGFGIAVYQNRIYCIGGRNSSGKTTSLNEVYDPETDTWEIKKPMPTARRLVEANVADGKIYLMGGEPDRTLNEAYDPETDSWIRKASIPFIETGYNAVGGDYYASAVVDNEIYLIGIVGFFAQGEGAKLLNQIYNPETDSWTVDAPPPSGTTPDAAGVTTGMWAPKRIYIIGRDRSNRAYDPASDSWICCNSVPSNLPGFGVAVANDKLYVIGGQRFDFNVYHYMPSDGNREYTPFGYGTIPPVVSVVSPENKMYNVTDVSLAFTLNKPALWMGYNLDGQDNVTVTSNITLSGLANGLHNVTVYARDEFENIGASETIYFTIDAPEPFPTIPVAVASVAAVIVVGAGLLIYFRKRKQ
jgi:N-acetylneuraminic acid mutarotase